MGFFCFAATEQPKQAFQCGLEVWHYGVFWALALCLWGNLGFLRDGYGVLGGFCESGEAQIGGGSMCNIYHSVCAVKGCCS